MMSYLLQTLCHCWSLAMMLMYAEKTGWLFSTSQAFKRARLNIFLTTTHLQNLTKRWLLAISLISYDVLSFISYVISDHKQLAKNDHYPLPTIQRTWWKIFCSDNDKKMADIWQKDGWNYSITWFQMIFYLFHKLCHCRSPAMM